LPEPGEDVLVELTVSGHQDEPWTRRVCADGAVWEHTNLRTWIEDGQVRQEHQPLQWERRTTAPPEALARIADVVRANDLLHTSSPQTGSVIGVGTTVWRIALDGESHEIRVEHLPADRVHGLAELDQAVQLAVAMGVDPGT
jgi:hypothetical protein